MKNIRIKDIIDIKKVLPLILSIVTYAGLCLNYILPTYNISSWLIFFSLTILFYKSDLFNKENRKEILFLTILFSFIIVYGGIAYNNLYNRSSDIFKELLTLKSLLHFISAFNLIYLILINIYPHLASYNFKVKRSLLKSKKMVFLISFIVILVGWLPYFLSYYPATITSDSLSELITVINNFDVLSDHHPIIHTIFIAIPYNIGFFLTHKISIAVSFVTISQMLIMASIFSSFLVFLFNRKVNDKLLLLILAFYAFMPLHGYYSIVMWKDVIFSGLLLLLTMELVKIIEKEKSKNLNFKQLLSFIIISILCIFFRNNAVYMYFILAIVTLIIFKKYYKVFLASFVIIFGIYFVVKGPIFSYFNVKKSASAEYIGMPLQQLGRMAYKDVTFTAEEKELIDKLMPVEIMKDAYDPKISDSIKFNENYNGASFDEHKFAYLKLWLSLILKHPKTALEAYTMSTLGYWYPGVEEWAVAKEIYENDYDLKRDSKAGRYVDYFLDKIESRQIPVLNIEWSIGLCFWIILISAILLFTRKKKKYLYVFVPIAGIFLTMLIASPVYGEFRYVYGAYTCLPLLCLMPYLKLKDSKNKE